LDKVKQMRGVSYEWSNDAQNNMNLDSLQHIGFIAQEVAAIEPLLTFVDDSSLVHVNYDRVAPLLVESVKELDDKILAKDSIINHLQNEINTIKECLRTANICYGEGNRTINQNPNSGINQKSIELINSNSIILDQNLPNPFAENTVINYNIPADVIEAKLLFYDLNGRIIKELVIEERGESKLTVYGSNLKTGVYTYSLIADGELIATKKMVKK
ncbi:MAG: tail fiber domain-containing protein, partial [Flavobacteriales bacterium]|nr:tail fiber domain-containing protein [Flavobacteriales bacterium]